MPASSTPKGGGGGAHAVLLCKKHARLLSHGLRCSTAALRIPGTRIAPHNKLCQRVQAPKPVSPKSMKRPAALLETSKVQHAAHVLGCLRANGCTCGLKAAPLQHMPAHACTTDENAS